MNTRFNSFLINPFQKNIATLFSGTFVAQLINVIGALFLAKIYAPELYGTYNVFLSFTSILIILNTLKLEYIVVTENSNLRSINLVFVLSVLVLIISLFHYLFFVLSGDYFLKKHIEPIILFSGSLASIFLASTKIFESFATRTLLFKNIAQARVILSISTVSLQVLLFFFYNNGLIYGYTIALIITSIYFIYVLKPKRFIFNWKLFKNSIKNHKNILKFAFPSGLINSIGINLMPILLISYFSASTTGVYALSLKIVSVPLFLISSSISQVYFQKASLFFNESRNKLYQLTKKVALSSIITMLVILVLINTIGLILLGFIFDKQWQNLNLFVLILSFYMLCQSAFVPISHIIVIVDKMSLGLTFNIFLVCINLIAIYVGTLLNDILYTVLILSIIGGAGYLFLLIYFLSYLKSFKYES